MSRARVVPGETHARRIATLRNRMREAKVDTYMVCDRMDQYWLTGFTGEDGYVLVTDAEICLLTDGRFDETAAHEAPWARKIVRKNRGPEATIKELKRLKTKRLGFDPDHLSVRKWAELNKLAKGAKLISASGLIGEMRQIKDADEVARIRKAIRIAEAAYERVRKWLRPGLSERQVAAQLQLQIQELGGQGPAFHPIVAVGAGGSLPHYEPGDRLLNEREGILIDWGARADWYISDLTRTEWLGTIPPQLKDVYNIVLEAHDRAIAVIKPGISASKVDATAREFIAKSGYGKNFNHSVGHGIGLNVHEAPGLRRQAKDKLKAGMVVTIEPGIYLPGIGGVRIEDDVLVTETGCEVLSSRPRPL